MANHKSSEKRIRQTKTRVLRNRYAAKTMRNALKKIRTTDNKDEVKALFPKVCSMLDKLAKRNIIHKNKAGNLKSKIARRYNALQVA
ncbi:MAG: 30S ribosomal protein S20 [Tannerella sp.]|jgi:small subunit ribosomal protein S20|nr:30S ribosomal protein S20 [Tannerella sp.]